MNEIEKNLSDRYSPSNSTKAINCLMAALLFGFGWHIRGSGTSDPTVVMVLFLLFIGFLFSPRKKFNAITFGLIILLFRIMRRGWGTFVSQAGIPGIYEGNLQSPTEGYAVQVAWWQGYFWLFIVGLAWSGLAALILGGYNFSTKKYNYKDLVVFIILFLVGFGIGLLIAIRIIPVISPEAYYEIYSTGVSERNFISMRDNFAFAFAIVPVLIYILAVKKDVYFVKITVIIMLIFGIALSAADIFQVLGRNNLEWGWPFWSMWEYFTGFITGSLILLIFYFIPEERWNASDMDIGFFPADTPLKKILLYLIGHVALFLWGINESFMGLINSSARALGYDLDLSSAYGLIIILAIDIPLYYLYINDTFLTGFKSKSSKEKCIILLILLTPFYYICYVMQFIVSGTYIGLEMAYLVTWLDTISVIIVEIYFIYLYITFRNEKIVNVNNQ